MKDESHTASAMLVLDSSAVSEVDSDGKFFVESDNYVYDRWLLNTINRYDVLANNTSSEPLIGGWGSNKEIRHFNDRSQLDEDISGKFVNLEEMIEGNTWVQTTKGLRLPRSCLPRRRRVAVEQPVLELNAMRADYEENGFGSPDHALLLNEDKAGRPLVATRRTPGLGDVEPLRRKSTRSLSMQRRSTWIGRSLLTIIERVSSCARRELGVMSLRGAASAFPSRMAVHEYVFERAGIRSS